MPQQTNSRLAAGTINPFSFVQTDPANTYWASQNQLSCLQCSGPGVEILGIAHEWTNAPYGLAGQSAQGVPAATAGQRVRIYGDGEETIIMVGSGYTVMTDNLLVSDASGNAIPLTLTDTSKVNWIGARALEAGVAGDPIRVTVVLRPYLGHA